MPGGQQRVRNFVSHHVSEDERRIDSGAGKKEENSSTTQNEPHTCDCYDAGCRGSIT